MSEIEFDNFIMLKEDILTKEDCQDIIDYTKDNLEEIKILSQVVDGGRAMDYKDRDPEDAILRHDLCFYMSHGIYRHLDEQYYKVINQIADGLEEYIQKYPALANSITQGYHNPDLKYHIVHAGGGYHHWHSEWNVVPPDNRRFLVWHVSLTSHKNEGELEFLYFDNRVEPKAGRLIIWPANFPWVHRGNAIRSDTEKHYLTGWFFIGG